MRVNLCRTLGVVALMFGSPNLTKQVSTDILQNTDVICESETAKIWDFLKERHGEPWPSNATDCEPWNDFVDKRRAFRAGALEKLKAALRVFSLPKEAEPAPEDIGPLSADELFCLESWRGRVKFSADMIRKVDLSCTPLMHFTYTPMRLKHDTEQLAYLLVKGSLPPCFWGVLDAFSKLLVSALSMNESFGGSPRMIWSEEGFNSIGLFYDTVLYIPKVPVVKHVINPLFDFKLAQQQYFANSPHYVILDNFLTAEALDALLTTALESTIWFDMKWSYLGAYRDLGLVNEVVTQLVQEIRVGFPDIVGDLELVNFWAYKYEQGSDGIALHADQAVVNLNFWVVPDSANQDETSGGIVIYLKEPPANADNFQFNRGNNVSARKAFVEDAPSVMVPYRCNRVVIFSSRLVHNTAVHNFKPGYESRRINFTLLFGRPPQQNAQNSLPGDWTNFDELSAES